MANNRRDVDKGLVQQLRTRFLDELQGTEKDIYHPDDIARVKENDWYITRYILHQQNNVDEALKMMRESLKWRKEFQANTISETDLPLKYFAVRMIQLYNEDKEGNPIVLIRQKACKREASTRKLQQLYFVYWVEKAVKSSDWGEITILSDCRDSGFSNMDIYMVLFMVNMFAKHYPLSIKNSVVCNFPRIFSGIWRMVRPFIPQRLRSKVHFVDETGLQKFVNPDQLPVSLGGTCSKLYEPKEEIEED